MKASWLFDEHPLLVDKKLADVIGLNEAVALQQVNYWLHAKGGKNADGKHWIKHSVKEFKEKDFPFWSESTIKRTITHLQTQGYLLTNNLNNAGFDKTNWYSIDIDKLNKDMNHASVQNDPTSGSKWTDRKGQNEPTYTRDYPDTSSDTHSSSTNGSHKKPKDPFTITANSKKEEEDTIKKIIIDFERLTVCPVTPNQKRQITKLAHQMKLNDFFQVCQMIVNKSYEMKLNGFPMRDPTAYLIKSLQNAR